VPIPKTTPARIQIQEVSPQVDCGRYPVKRTAGDEVEVTARIFRDGHETLGAAVRHKGPDATRWSETPLAPLGNDLWAGSSRSTGPVSGASALRPGSTVSPLSRKSCGARWPRARPT